ncbi:hypothetical protein [Nostoc sp.]
MDEARLDCRLQNICRKGTALLCPYGVGYLPKSLLLTALKRLNDTDDI